MVLLVFLLLLSSAYAYDLNATRGSSDWNAIGNQIVRGSFSGDYNFFALIMLMLFAIFAWQARLPMGATLGIGLITLFGLGPMILGYSTLLNLVVLSIGVLIGLAILHFVRR